MQTQSSKKNQEVKKSISNSSQWSLLSMMLIGFITISLLIQLSSSASMPCAYSCRQRRSCDLDRWSYKNSQIISHFPFDKLNFLCRFFGFRCNANSPNLSPMQQEFVSTYNQVGTYGNFFGFLYKHAPKFLLENFCNINNLQEKKQCAAILQMQYSYAKPICNHRGV